MGDKLVAGSADTPADRFRDEARADRIPHDEGNSWD